MFYREFLLIKLTIKYFLTPEGFDCFPMWVDEVKKAVSLQSGFVTIQHYQEQGNPVVVLIFENSDKLNQWAETDVHDALYERIADHFLKPLEVVKEETIN